MPFDDDNVSRRLLHIRENVQLALHFVEDQTYEMFLDDPRTLYATTRCLEIISEASRHLPTSLKERHPTIAWKDMAGAGNIYRHDYEDVSARRVWSAVQKHLPPLLATIDQEIAELAGKKGSSNQP